MFRIKLTFYLGLVTTLCAVLSLLYILDVFKNPDSPIHYNKINISHSCFTSNTDFSDYDYPNYFIWMLGRDSQELIWKPIIPIRLFLKNEVREYSCTFLEFVSDFSVSQVDYIVKGDDDHSSYLIPLELELYKQSDDHFFYRVDLFELQTQLSLYLDKYEINIYDLNDAWYMYESDFKGFLITLDNVTRLSAMSEREVFLNIKTIKEAIDEDFKDDAKGQKQRGKLAIILPRFAEVTKYYPDPKYETRTVLYYDTSYNPFKIGISFSDKSLIQLQNMSVIIISALLGIGLSALIEAFLSMGILQKLRRDKDIE